MITWKHLRVGAVMVALAAVAVAIALAPGCSSGGSGGGSSPTPSAKPSGPVVLTVTGATGTKKYTLRELKALPAVHGFAGIKSSVGTIYPPIAVSGVALTTLVDLVGGLTPDKSVTLFAKDGYGMTFSYDQVMHHKFTAFDPATGDEVTPDAGMTMVLAYEEKGKPIDPDSEGPLRLDMTVPALPGQVVDGHWSVKWVDKVEVAKATAPWTVALEGAVSSSITRGSYVNCASPGCHGSGYVTPSGARYEGVPLWLAVGLVDNKLKHGKGAYDTALARKGYKIYLFAADGHSVVLDSRTIDHKNSIILSSKLNGAELPDTEAPMRLVGPGLSDAQQIGRIVKIVLRLP
jgi:DMSO/TMAO reductase YedYZ molybdopterin-dependent catalytic subunit